jgi:hypothetical protein
MVLSGTPWLDTEISQVRKDPAGTFSTNGLLLPVVTAGHLPHKILAYNTVLYIILLLTNHRDSQDAKDQINVGLILGLSVSLFVMVFKPVSRNRSR